jgi:hypothetical protein
MKHQEPFNQQQMTSEIGKTRYLWTTFARRAHSALALAAAAQAFGALAREMDAYDAYHILQQQQEPEGETPDVRAYEEVLTVLSRACENWWRAASTLASKHGRDPPSGFCPKRCTDYGLSGTAPAPD